MKHISRRALASLIFLMCSPAVADIGIANRDVSIRVGPDPASRNIAVLQKDSEVRILSRQGASVRVMRLSDGLIGYLHPRALDYRAGDVPVPAPELPVSVVHISAIETDSTADKDQSRQSQKSEKASVASAQFVDLESIQTDEVEVSLHQGEDERRFADDDNQVSKMDAWYITADAGYARGDMTANKLDSSLRGSSTFVEVTQLDESSASWSLNLGYRLNPRWAVEVGLLDLGEYSSRVEVRNANESEVRRIIAGKHPVGGAGVRGVAVAQIRQGAWTASANAGLFQSFDTDISILLDGQPVTVKGEDFSVVFGAAAGYRVSQHWSVELLGSYLELNQAVVNSGLRLHYTF